MSFYRNTSCIHHLHIPFTLSLLTVWLFPQLHWNAFPTSPKTNAIGHVFAFILLDLSAPLDLTDLALLNVFSFGFCKISFLPLLQPPLWTLLIPAALTCKNPLCSSCFLTALKRLFKSTLVLIQRLFFHHVFILMQSLIFRVFYISWVNYVYRWG